MNPIRKLLGAAPKPTNDGAFSPSPLAIKLGTSATTDFMIKATPRVKGLDDLTVAAFGRQIGMRDHGRFPALVTSGHTSATRKQNPITGLTQLYMTEADIAVFHERYFTLPTMAREYGIDRRALLTRLKSSEIRPFKPNDQDYGHLYLRKDVDAFLK